MSCCGGQCGCSSHAHDTKKPPTEGGCCTDSHEELEQVGGCCGGHDHAVELSAEQIALLNKLIEDNSDEDLTPEEVAQIRSILFAQ